jgi:ABC-type lipoprotein export system ATPase subunit
MSIILRADNITKKYNSEMKKNALEKTNFTVEQGSIHVVEGKSGSGKSTFLSIIGGMEFPTSGKVYYKNESFYDLPDDKQSQIRGEKFGFVFQSFQLIPELTVRENIELPLKFLKKKEAKLKVSVKELAKELGIDSQLDKRPSFLSGGEQQRAAIARALITEPEILFADEPTGNLDQMTTKSIVNLLTKLNRERNLSLVVVTHEPNLFQVPHYLYSMKNGVLERMNSHV